MKESTDKLDTNHYIEQFRRHDGYRSYATSADYTITDIDKIKTLFVTTAAATITITLPPAADNLDRVIEILKVDLGSGKITVDGEGAETISGLITRDILLKDGCLKIKSNGISWDIMPRYVHSDIWHYIGTVGEPAFQNSWVNYGNPYDDLKFKKDNSGFVHIEGGVKNGADNVIFTLPVQYRPTALSPRIYFPAISNNAFAGVLVFSNGGVARVIGSTASLAVNIIFEAEI